MHLFLILHGADKHAPACLMPVDGLSFLYDPMRNQHVLDGGALTPERFNAAQREIAARFDGTQTHYRILAVAEPSAEPEPPDWQDERQSLLERIEAQTRLLAFNKKKPAAPAAEPIAAP
jgi:hypothetical protein